MFYSTAPKTGLGATYRTLELIYHTAVRNVRKTHNNAVIAILMNMLQVALMVLAFYFMFSVLGLRGLALVLRAVPDVAWLLLLAAALRMGHAAAVPIAIR